jgi:TPR repeat protein
MRSHVHESGSGDSSGGSLMDVDLHHQHSHLHQLSNRELADLEFASDDENLIDLDDIDSMHNSSSSSSDFSNSSSSSSLGEDDDVVMTGDCAESSPSDGYGESLSKREMDFHMRNLLHAMLTNFSHSDVYFDSELFVDANQKAAQWYSSLIKQAPTLYATQKDSLLSHGAGDRMVCRCFLLKHYATVSHLQEQRILTVEKYGEIIAELLDRPVSLLFFKLDEFMSSSDYEFHPVRLALLSLKESKLRVDDNKQWASVRNFVKSMPALAFAGPPSGCSLDCRCDCLACSAISGNPAHMKLLGTCFHQGFAVPQDFEWALCWYSLASVMGVASALNSIGFMYQEGHGVDANSSQGILWYHLAARAGDRTAQYNMACAYYNGCGVDKDHKKAFEWYYLAAKRGDIDAQAAVGDQYYQSVLLASTLCERRKYNGANNGWSSLLFWLGDGTRSEEGFSLA